MLVVLRYQVSESELTSFLGDARTAISTLSRRPGFIRGNVGRATDDGDLVIVSLEWADVGSYRRALSSFEVKTEAVPLLSRSLNEPSAFEILHSRGPEGVTDAVSSLAPNGGIIE
jgi:hypothetical protein